MTEHEELLRDVLVRCEIDCVVDVGAHLGQFGQLLRSIGYEGEIVSFEPVLPVFAALAKTAKDDGRWQAHRLALGSEDGTAELNVPEATDFASFLRPNDFSLAEFGGHTAVERTEQVPVRRLDGVVGEYVPAEARLFLKLDTQGWELEVLGGAAKTLERVAALQVELSFQPLYEGTPRAAEVRRFLAEQGFAVAGFFTVARDKDLRLIEADCVMIRHG